MASPEAPDWLPPILQEQVGRDETGVQLAVWGLYRRLHYHGATGAGSTQSPRFAARSAHYGEGTKLEKASRVRWCRRQSDTRFFQ